MIATETNILIREPDGICRPFSVSSLQSRLASGFIGVGRGDSAYLAEDIALAVEYSMRHGGRPEMLFERGELDSAVVRALEQNGFGDVAGLFAVPGNGGVITVDTSAREEIAEILANHLSCGKSRIASVVAHVSDALRRAGIREASPQLLLEMARHFTLAESAGIAVPDGSGPDSREPVFSDEALELLGSGVVRYNGGTRIFPSIRFHFMIGAYAKSRKWSVPATEMEIAPDLWSVGMVLDGMRRELESAYGDNPPPCTLAIPDMNEFLSEYFQQKSPDGRTARELAGMLVQPLSRPLYKLTME
ncbi:MAG: hypothetical protein MJ025_07295 [Victivallaceae bacterium]|nr:hypothetical protein [Victivallaceae bacterium]